MLLNGRTTLTCPVVDEDPAPCSEKPPRSTIIPPAPASVVVVSIRARDLEQQFADDVRFDDEDERPTLKRGVVPATTTWRCPA